MKKHIRTRDEVLNEGKSEFDALLGRARKFSQAHDIIATAFMDTDSGQFLYISEKPEYKQPPFSFMPKPKKHARDSRWPDDMPADPRRVAVGFACPGRLSAAKKVISVLGYSVDEPSLVTPEWVYFGANTAGNAGDYDTPVSMSHDGRSMWVRADLI